MGEYKSLDKITEYLNNKNYRVVVLCGLPGSGKSTLGKSLRKELGYCYVSSDVARVRRLKLTVGKFATTDQYNNYKNQVYTYMRKMAEEKLAKGGRVVLDATHLNEQRRETLSFFRGLKVKPNELVIVYVDGGKKDVIKRRLMKRSGKNADGRSWEEAWEVAYDYFVKLMRERKVKVPSGKEQGYQVVVVRNW